MTQPAPIKEPIAGKEFANHAWVRWFQLLANNVGLVVNGLFRTNGGRVKNIRVESTDTTLLATDHVLRMNVDGGDKNVFLPPLVDGTEYWIENCSIDTGNKINWIPDGTDLLFGVNETFPVYDEEDFVVVGEPTKGWR